MTAHRHLLQRDPTAKTVGQAALRPPSQWAVWVMWAVFLVATVLALRPDPQALLARNGIPAEYLGFYAGDDDCRFAILTIGRGGIAFDRTIMVPSESVYEARDRSSLALVDIHGMWYFLTPSADGRMVAERGTPGDRLSLGTYRRGR